LSAEAVEIIYQFGCGNRIVSVIGCLREPVGFGNSQDLPYLKSA